MVREEEYLVAHGHPNVTALHRTTFEITREKELSLAGTCIIAVGADKGAADLDRRFCKALSDPEAVLETTLSCGPHKVRVLSQGDPGLVLTHPTDLVWRKSSFTCGRTIGVYADHTAQNILREMVALLQNGEDLEVSLVVTSPDKPGSE
ncbi:DUF371 domain-containing protein [Methanospirillum stamsii]|uniref:DUF371 domain-containing protein n=1 Tax=Methanospirillum stamsii TaxID=1277351 RepID=A0A2V2N9K4_9EURY|nr:DUF371 domain-containing protein [Methanospirillum stamsii]PWR75410.1 DUF371 domain-containing protein [Methanospirillum stamsii]